MLPGFETKHYVMKDPKHKPIVGEEELVIAMDLMGLQDRHEDNLGYIDLGDELKAARVDFDLSFLFDPMTFKLDQTNDKYLKAIESIAKIPDEMFLYVLGDAYNDLWGAGFSIDYNTYKDLGGILLARKKELENYLEFQTLYNKAKDNLSTSTLESENLEHLNEFIAALYDKYDTTPLEWAIINNEMDFLNLFLDKGVDVNVQNSLGVTALMRAIEKDNLETVRLLLEKGADVNMKDNKSNTPLIQAAANGNLEVVMALLEKGADVHMEDDSGYTPLMRAVAEKRNLEIVRLLLDKDANVNEKNYLGYTPLMFASMIRGNLDIVNLLLNRGADINAKNSMGQTALDLAERTFANQDIIYFLYKKMQTTDQL